MMLSLAVVLLLTSAPSDDRLVGAWSLEGHVLFELKAGGQGTMEGEAIRWQAAGGVLTISGGEGESEQIAYSMRGAQLVISMNGIELPLTKSGATAPVEKKEPVAKKNESSSQLAQLLLSSAWCSFSYKNGTTRKSRVVFLQDGTWSSNSNRETQWSGQNGSYYGANSGGDGGQWQANGETLMMSAPPQYPQLVAVPYSVALNSNGYPIITVAGTEYMRCE